MTATPTPMIQPRPWGRRRLGLAYILAIATLTACDRNPQPTAATRPAARGMRVVVIGPGGEHPQWPGIRGGAERYARAVPAVSVQCFSPQDASAEAVVQTLSEAAGQRPGALCLFLTEGCRHAAGDIAAALHGPGFAGTFLVTMGARLPQVQASGHVGIDWPGAAEQLAAQAPALVPLRRSFVLLHADGVSAGATDCYQRFRSASRRVESESWNLLRELNSASCSTAPKACVEELMALFPHAGLIVALDPAAWHAASPEWERNLIRRYPQMRFATLSAAPVLWHWLGTPAAPGPAAALVGPVDGDLGYAAVQMAVEGRVGTQGSSPPRYLACEIVTPATLPAFARRYADAANNLDVTQYLAGAIEIGPQDEAR